MYVGLHVKSRLFFSDCNETWIFFDSCSKNTQILNFMKIRPLEAELFNADRRTDMTKLIVTFLNFSNEPKNECVVCGWNNLYTFEGYANGYDPYKQYTCVDLSL